jgi:hypothetical protein
MTAVRGRTKIVGQTVVGSRSPLIYQDVKLAIFLAVSRAAISTKTSGLSATSRSHCLEFLDTQTNSKNTPSTGTIGRRGSGGRVDRPTDRSGGRGA